MNLKLLSLLIVGAASFHNSVALADIQRLPDSGRHDPFTLKMNRAADQVPQLVVSKIEGISYEDNQDRAADQVPQLVVSPRHIEGDAETREAFAEIVIGLEEPPLREDGVTIEITGSDSEMFFNPNRVRFDMGEGGVKIVRFHAKSHTTDTFVGNIQVDVTNDRRSQPYNIEVVIPGL